MKPLVFSPSSSPSFPLLHCWRFLFVFFFFFFFNALICLTATCFQESFSEIAIIGILVFSFCLFEIIKYLCPLKLLLHFCSFLVFSLGLIFCTVSIQSCFQPLQFFFFLFLFFENEKDIFHSFCCDESTRILMPRPIFLS